MTCSVSGAYLGAEAIPKDWRGWIENAEKLEELARRLAALDGKVE